MATPRHAIVSFFNDRYFDYFRACYHSLKRNYPAHPPLLVAYDGHSPDVEAFLDRTGITRISPDRPPRHDAIDPNRIKSPIVFDRFSLWTDYFDDYDNLLHLDVDTLVLGSLDEIISSPGFFIIANHEPWPTTRVFVEGASEDADLHALLREDGLDYPHDMDDMANAGVFVLPRRFRNSEEHALIERLTMRYGPYLAYADQSVISLWCLLRGIPYSRDYRFNCQTPLLGDESLRLDLDEVRLLHFSNHKPDTEAFLKWKRLNGLNEKLRTMYRSYRYADEHGSNAAQPEPKASPGRCLKIVQ